MPSEREQGLCAACRQMRRVTSGRGSVFIMCERSRTDARFAKYPRLPVVRCEGYEPASGLPGASPDPPR